VAAFDNLFLAQADDSIETLIGAWVLDQLSEWLGASHVAMRSSVRRDPRFQMH
jgi:hypothetical protein